jgi:hypothetical protein
MCFMHLYMKYTQPLFIQGVMPLKSLYDSNARPSPSPYLSSPLVTPTHTPSRKQILKIHLLNKPATGDLKRPFAAAPSMFTPGGATDSSAAAEEPAKITEIKDEKKKDK